MIKNTAVAAALAALMLTGSPVSAANFEGGDFPGGDLIDDALVESIREWATQPITLISVRAQNERFADLTNADIQGLDQRWRVETKADEQPIIAQLVSSPLSSYLLQIQARSLGLYSEIFVMDAKGLNVGISSVTSDYWQGDESKWQKTFAVGPDAVFIDKPEFNEETRTQRVQVSLPLIDPDTHSAIGAITAEINLTELIRRKANAF